MSNKKELHEEFIKSYANFERMEKKKEFKREVKSLLIKLGVTSVIYLVIGFALGFGCWTGLHFAARLF